ncbi:MAG: tetratricopeptide repeat protein, partial [Planctomycetaceae bacterium]|nr:tetratricopeptide repeat protein [Planctomycetaceae bacterium]
MKSSEHRQVVRDCMILVMIVMAIGGDVLCFAQNDRPVSPETQEACLSDRYFAVQAIFDSGNFIEAIQEYGTEIRRVVQNGRSHWVDSICYHARVGECHYQMGGNDSAMACFDIALQDYLDNDEWPHWLHFDTASGVQYKAKSLPPWGDRSLSSGELAVIPDRVLIDFMFADIDGGDSRREFVLAPDSAAIPIHPTEVAVCMAMALYRRAELLGLLGACNDLNDKLVARLRRNPFPDDHWSAAWGNILLALALAAAGNDIEAKPLLEQSLQIENTADHPLTGFAQLELGKMALRAGDYTAAHRHFVAASHSGWHYANTFVTGEAFRYVAVTQKMITPDTNANVLPKALEWAERERLRGLQIWLNTLLAEDSISRRDLVSAKAQLKRAQDLTGEHDIKHGRLAGNWSYLEAMDAYNS